jgi:hypothetical protein
VTKSEEDSMPRRFRCPDCDLTITTYMLFGERTRCPGCRAEVEVPSTAEETDADGPPGPGPGVGLSPREFTGHRPERVTIAGKPLTCRHCGEEKFHERSVLLNTRLLTWLNMDWMNEAARVFACAECGCLHWFSGKAEEK